MTQIILHSKNSSYVCIEDNQFTSHLHAANNSGDMIKYVHDEKLDKESLQSFDVITMGKLSYYVDVLAMPKSSSYWCPWCI